MQASQQKEGSKMSTNLRIYLGDVENAEQVLEAIRTATREDSIGWYVAEELPRVPVGDHPRNPGHRWEELEASE